MSSRTCPDWPTLMELAPDLQFMHYTVAEAKLPAEALANLQDVQVEAVREAVDLDRLPVPLRSLDYGLDVDGVRRPAADVAPGRMAERRDVRVLECADRPLRQLLARLALAAVHARLHPVELGEHVVGQVELAVGTDVALGPG